MGDLSEFRLGLDANSGGLAVGDLVTLAAEHADLAEVVAAQLPELSKLRPSHVVVQLGPREVLVGYDESYFHARLVELCDGIRLLAPTASVELRAIPPFRDEGVGRERSRQLCNGVAATTASLRGYAFRV